MTKYLSPGLRAHRAHMRNVRFAQKRGTWSRLTKCVAAFYARKPESMSRHEKEQFEAAKVELEKLETLLDEMKVEGDTEREEEVRQKDEGDCQVDPFAHQKIREAEHREAMKK